jgi:hypothetical protein
MHLRGEEDPQCVVALTVVGDVAAGGASTTTEKTTIGWSASFVARMGIP